MSASSPDGVQRRAFVTGGASGIGLSIVRQVLAQDWHVHVADANAQALDSLAGELGEAMRAVTTVLLDVSDEVSVRREVQAAADAGPLKAVVNSAGIGHSIAFIDTPVETFRKILEVNLVGTFNVCHAAVQAMKESGGGSIVNISSGSGLRANAGRTAYGASKAGVELMSKVMATELAPLGIRVNTVAPGPIETPMVKAMHSAQDRARALAAVPMGMYGEPDDIANAVLFLLNDKLARYVTGETLCVDGGFFGAGQFSRAG
ncbi:MAG: SDR family oxidoreductase [Ramlibacter sp.]|nr:SDR family oxidoreductase [Ramlibacter sp.]